LQLLAAALLFSTGGAAIKAVSFTGWQVACFRSGVAALTLWILIPAVRRGFKPRFLLPALAYAATLILFVLSNKLTTAANTIFLQSTAPLYLLLLGPWLLKERIRRSDLLLMLAVAVGMSLFFVGKQAVFQTAPDPVTGNVLALISGVAWALTLAGLRWLGSGEQDATQGIATVTVGNVMVFLFCLPQALPVAGFAWRDLLVIGYLGVFQIGLAYVLLTRAVRYIPALESSLLLLAEPALNPVWAWLVHGEKPTLPAMAGGILILSASLVQAMRPRRGV
jgi:DME family drug/metabolite transporter